MNKTIHVVTVIMANQTEHIEAIIDKEQAYEAFVRLYNSWTESEKILETYDECMEYYESKQRTDDSEFDSLLINIDEVIIS